MPRKFKLSIEHLWAATVLTGVFIFVSTHPIRPQDFWWHIAIGREIAAKSSIPLLDTYSYTMAGQPYPAYQIYWLMETALFNVFRTGGGELIVFFQSLLITGAYGVLLGLCFILSRSWRVAAFSVLFAAALGLNDWNVRPQAVTFLLGALILLAIHQIRRTRRTSWLLVFPIVMVVWANSHGTFALGLSLIGIWWLDEVWHAIREKGKWSERLVWPSVALITTALACLLTPQGIGIVNYLRSMAGSPVIQNLVTEWAPPTFESLGGALFFVGLILTASIMAISPKRPSVFQLLTFAAFAALGLKTMRGVVWFGIVMAPTLAEHLKAIVDTYMPISRETSSATGSKLLNTIFLSVLVLMSVVSMPWFKQYLPLPALKAGVFSSETPFDATRFMLTERLPNPIFNAMSFGSYLIWEAAPEYPVFIDPRIDLYKPDVILDYITTSGGGENWQETLDRYGVQTIMASPSEQKGLIERLDQSEAWLRIYTDSAAVIFLRK
jgi:hypothetical protein